MSDRPDVPARVVWSGCVLGTPARVVAGADACTMQAQASGHDWAPADAVLDRAVLGEAVLFLAGRGSLACYLHLEKAAETEARVPAEVIREVMDMVWYRILSKADRDWLDARGAVSAAAEPVDGSKER